MFRNTLRIGWSRFASGFKELDETPLAKFALLATVPDGTKLIVAHPKALPRYLQIETSIVFAPQDKAFLDGLREEE